jgi:hypothetical protein
MASGSALMFRGRATSWIGYVALFFLLLLAPYAWAFHAIGPRAWLRALAADAMYYLAIANNWNALGFPTFDWVEPSTGFHPLWLLLLAVLLRWVPFQAQVFVVVVACMLCLSVALTLAHRALSRGLEPGTWRLLLAVSFFPGLYALTLDPVTAQALSPDPGVLYRLIPWSVPDGMESSLTLLLQATFVSLAFSGPGSLHAGSRDASTRGLWLSIPLALVVLARLDDVIFVGAMGLPLLTSRALTFRRRFGLAGRLFAGPIIVALLYVLGLRLYGGLWLPTSAAQKAGWHLPSNWDALLSLLTLRSNWWAPLAVRLLPLLYGAILGGATLAFALARRRRDESTAAESVTLHDLTIALAGYVLVKTLFIFCGVNVWGQGYWYFHTIVFWANGLAGMWIVRTVVARASLARLSLGGTGVVALASMLQVAFLLSGPKEGYARGTFALWRHGDEIRADLLRLDPEARIVDNFDGMYAYFLRLPAESVTGLVSGRASLERRKRVGFYKSLIERGYTLFPMPAGDRAPGYRDPARDGQECIPVYKHEASELRFCRLGPGVRLSLPERSR